MDSRPTIPTAIDWSGLIVEAAPNAMIIVDRERTIVLVNRGAELLFGYDRSELTGQKVDLLVPARLSHSHAAHIESFFSAPRTRSMGMGRDLYGKRKDGSEVPIEIGLTPLEAANTRFTLASIIDISERRRAEEQFRIIVEAAPNAKLVIDRTRKITLVNRSTEQLFGYPRAELLGEPIEKLVPPRFREHHHMFVDSFFRDPQARPMGGGRDLFGLRRDGTEVPIEIGLTPMQTPSGVQVLASIIDISERKKAEAAQARLAAIVESSEDAILSQSLDGVITSWNRGAEVLFGYQASEAIGQNIRMLDAAAEGHPIWTNQGSEGGRFFEPFEAKWQRKDRRHVDVSVRTSPLHSASGELIGVSKIARDITEQKRRDEEFQRSNAELEQFAYVASHDLQEPLRMVANYTELLADRYRGKLDEKADKYIFYASDGARRMQRLVADLLAYSRIGSQGKPLLVVSSEEVVKSVVHSLGQLVKETGATVEYHYLPPVLADEVQLRQLFQNLIGNAIKFRSDSPPRIIIRSTREGSYVHFEVIDNGIGIDLKYATRIFQMFQRLHEIGKYEGSGIGLAIAKRIVERHGGRIWINSTPNAGTTFHFTLSCAPRGES
jgi:PAS domain S-box-containing protein